MTEFRGPWAAEEPGGDPADPKFKASRNLPEDPDLTYNPGGTSLLGIYPSTFPTKFDGFAGPSLLTDLSDEAPLQPSPPASGLELIEPLAQGGFGEVWLGRQSSLRRTVAVKRLREDQLLGLQPEQRRALFQLFRHEAMTTALLEHPNIVPVYELVDDADGNPQLSMKRVKGRSWHEVLVDELQNPSGDFLSRHLPILIDVAQAVAFAHSQGILHRDIKPHQVMVGEFGEVLLMDWGLAMEFGEPADVDVPFAPEDSDSFSSGAFAAAGTPSFMAPEQALGNLEDIGPWTDLYLLGGVLYYLLTGTPPHAARTSMAALMLASKSQVTPPAERSPERHLPEDLVDLAMSVLVADPQQRTPRTVQEFITGLQEYLSGASRRNRSRAMVQEVIERPVGSDYLDFEQPLALLHQAHVLWPGNPDLDGVKDQVLEAYIDLALSQRDLTLAQVQAQQLSSPARREEVLQRIRKAIEQRRRDRRQRRWTRFALAAVLLVLVVGGFKYAYDQQRANERLAAERDAAQTARADAEDLMSFMLDDLWERLRSVNRTDIMTTLSNRAQVYYANRELDGMSDEETLNLSHAMQTLSEVLGRTGQFDEAIATERRALKILGGLEGSDLDAEDLYWRRMLGESALAGHLRDIGDAAASEALFRQVIAQLKAATAQHPETTMSAEEDLRDLLGSNLDGFGILLFDMGRLEEALVSFQEAKDVLVAVRVEQPSSLDLETDAEIDFRIAATLFELGQLAPALESIQRSIRALDESLRLNPGDLELKLHIGFERSVEADILLRLGRFAEARRLTDVEMPWLGAALQEDPQNADTRYSYLLWAQLDGDLHQARGDLAAARTAWRHGVAMGNEALPTDHSYIVDTLVRLHLALGDVDAARPLALDLHRKGWTHRDFAEYCGRFGLELDDLN